MPDAATADYLGVPGYFLLWLLSLTSFAVFGSRVLRHINVLTQARPDPRWDHLAKRSLRVVTQVLGQRRLLNERVIGIAHLLIFWSFVVFAATFFWNLLRGLVPRLPILYPDDINGIAFVMEMFAMFGLAALCIAALRRYVLTPASLERSRDASIILVLIALVLVTFLMGSGFRALADPAGQAWRPIGRSLARGLAGAGIKPAAALSCYIAMWWLHMATVLGFLAYLPFSKHLHLLASPFAVFFSSLDAGRLPSHPEGAARVKEFSWRELFSGLACAECGRCDRVCPSFQGGLALSPKELVRRAKEALIAAEESSLGAGQMVLGQRVRAEELWACSTCAACMERCPVFNEHIPLVVEMRRALILSGECPARLQEVLLSLERYGNSFRQGPRARPKWCTSLNGWLKDARKEAVEYLWFTGDYAAYDPRVQPATRSVARLLQRAEINVGLLYDAERNAGNDVRRVGEEGLFEALRDHNLAPISSARFEKILTTDPHSYQALKHEYTLPNGSPVLHHTELLSELLRSGQLEVRHGVRGGVTYHDPCYLGRYNGVFAAPREVLRRIGAEVVEMPRNRRNAFCCGAGGGRIWMEEAPGHKERPAESRVREAAKLANVDTLVVSCPKDMVMFQDALKTTGLEGRLAVREIAELVEEAVTP